MKSLAFIVMLTLCLAVPARAETELSIYLGALSVPDSDLSGDFPRGGSFSQSTGWDERLLSFPPYYGLRGTWWQTERLGFGVELTHAKAYADSDTKDALGFDSLEFSDGLNILTANVMYRWPQRFGAVTPYVGGGLGVAIPHVDVNYPATGSTTLGYQVTGPAARLTAGMSLPLNDRFSVFGEYQFTYSSNDIDLDGGGSLQTDIQTNAINFGLSLNF